jgi:hypothetical protein
MSAPLFLLFEMLKLKLLAELTPVDFGPGVINLSIGLPAKLQLFIVHLAREDDGMHMNMSGIAMEGVEDGALGEFLLLMLVNHLPGLLVIDIFVKGINDPVITSGLPFSLVGPLLFIFVTLARILGEVRTSFVIAKLMAATVDKLRHVLRPDTLLLAESRPLFCVIQCAVPGDSGRAHAELQTDGHLLSAPVISASISATCLVARSITSWE